MKEYWRGQSGSDYLLELSVYLVILILLAIALKGC